MTHAKLSPSKAARWLHCPGSVASCLTLPDPGSEEADQGSACHLLLARMLRAGTKPQAGAQVAVVDPDTGRVVQVEVTDEMVGWVNSAADWVAHYATSNPLAILRVEALSPVGRYYGCGGLLYGHSDVVFVHAAELVVVDAKFGRVEVEGEDNPQLSLYAVGHMEEYAWRPERVTLAVLQPRSPEPVKLERLTRQQLRDRAGLYRPAIAAALQPDAALVPGEWCADTYCPAAGVCRALHERTAALAQLALRGPVHLTAAELADVLRGAKLVRKALDAAQAHALGQLAFGLPVPGFKRVMAEGHRKWNDEVQAAGILRALGLDPWKRVLLSPNQAEVALGEKSGALTPYAPKAKGQPALAPQDDPRPALEPDDEAFDNDGE